MANKGGQLGNNNAGKAKVWSEALRKHITQNPIALETAAKALLAKAMDGDIPALKELGDRLEGKAHQSLDLDANITGSVIIQASVLDEDI